MKIRTLQLVALLVTMVTLAGCHASPAWKWKTHVGDTHDTSIVAPLGVGDNMVFAVASQPRPGRYPGNAYQFMQAFDKDTGHFLWHYQLGRHPDVGGCGVTQPVFDRGIVYVALECSNIEAVDTSTGQKLWVFPPMGEIEQGKPLFAYPRIEECSTPVVAESEVYFLCSYSDMMATMAGEARGDADVLLALDRTSGYPVWEFLTPSSLGKSPIAVTQSNVFMVNGEKVLQAIDRKAGEVVWEFGTEFGITSPPFAVQGQIFTASYEGDMPDILILDEQTGEVDRQIPVAAEEGWLDRVALMDDVILGVLNVWRIEMPSKGYLYAIDAQTGQTRWRFSAGDSINPASLTFHDNTIFLSTYTTLFALDGATGKVKWRFRDRKGMVAPTLGDDVLYVGDDAGYIYAIPLDKE